MNLLLQILYIDNMEDRKQNNALLFDLAVSEHSSVHMDPTDVMYAKMTRGRAMIGPGQGYDWRNESIQLTSAKLLHQVSLLQTDLYRNQVCLASLFPILSSFFWKSACEYGNGVVVYGWFSSLWLSVPHELGRATR